MWCARASSEASPVVVPSLALPFLGMAPQWARRLSRSAVLPDAYGPTRAATRGAERVLPVMASSSIKRTGRPFLEPAPPSARRKCSTLQKHLSAAAFPLGVGDGFPPLVERIRSLHRHADLPAGHGGEE